jgi:rubrerythrin
MANTEKNLLEAFAGESQANRKYLAFAKKAEEEGYRQIAKLFRAAAEAETVHALNHLRELGGIKSTRENLEAAINGETYEFQKMYPEFIEDAKKKGKSLPSGALTLPMRWKRFMPNFTERPSKISAGILMWTIMSVRSAGILLREHHPMNALYVGQRKRHLKR